MVRQLCPAFDREAYLEGSMTPVYFGSALNNFGVRELLQGVADMAPSPRPQPTETRQVLPTEDSVSGFVFKIQANMDPNHPDRIEIGRAHADLQSLMRISYAVLCLKKHTTHKP